VEAGELNFDSDGDGELYSAAAAAAQRRRDLVSNCSSSRDPHASAIDQ
jgi:hypothetical protein